MRAAVRADAAGRIVLVGTYRPENADWIAAKRLYNLPLPKCGKLVFHARVGGIVLFAEGARPLAFAARFKEVADRARLAALRAIWRILPLTPIRHFAIHAKCLRYAR